MSARIAWQWAVLDNSSRRIAWCHNFKITTFRFPFIEVFSAFSTHSRRVLGMRDTKDTFLNFSRSLLPLICVIIFPFSFIFV